MSATRSPRCDPFPATKRQIWFAEERDGLRTGELRLLSAGVIVRIRSGEGPDDSTAKLRPCVESQLREPWTTGFGHKSLKYRIEGDWSGERRVLAGSAVVGHQQGSLADVAGADFADKALNTQQRQFLSQCANIAVPADRLVALGPIASTKWSDVPLGGMKVDAERWTVMDLDFLELSIRVEPRQHDSHKDFGIRAEKHQAELVAAIRDHELQIAADIDNKTQRVLTALASVPHA